MSDEEKKRIIKEALKEWLDERYAEVGRWSIAALLALGLAALIYFSLRQAGWTPPETTAINPR